MPAQGKAKACILFMWGGPAQQDTWDMKPERRVYRGDFKPIETSVPGCTCANIYRARESATDKFAVLRSMTHPDVNHTTATHYLLTGRRSRPGAIRRTGRITGRFWRNWVAARDRCRRS